MMPPPPRHPIVVWIRLLPLLAALGLLFASSRPARPDEVMDLQINDGVWRTGGTHREYVAPLPPPMRGAARKPRSAYKCAQAIYRRAELEEPRTHGTGSVAIPVGCNNALIEGPYRLVEGVTGLSLWRGRVPLAKVRSTRPEPIPPPTTTTTTLPPIRKTRTVKWDYWKRDPSRTGGLPNAAVHVQEELHEEEGGGG